MDALINQGSKEDKERAVGEVVNRENRYKEEEE